MVVNLTTVTSKDNETAKLDPFAVNHPEERPEMEEGNEWLSDLEGKFKAKLREVSTQSRQSTDGKTMTTFKLGKVEAAYDPEVVQKLAPGQLLAIPNVKTLKQNTSYSVFEIADIIPMHYSMLSLSTSQPGALRGEFMGLIEKEWSQNSKSTWVEIVASPTGYIGDFSPIEIKYERRYSPLLVGSAVKLLNKEAVRRFVCYVPEYRKGNPSLQMCMTLEIFWESSTIKYLLQSILSN